MPRAGTSMSQQQLRERYWGEGRRFNGVMSSSNTVPRTNGEVFLAITATNNSTLMCIADTLATQLTHDGNAGRTVSAVIGGVSNADGTLLRNYFALYGVFWNAYKDEYGLTLEGQRRLKDAITTMLSLNTGSVGTINPVLAQRDATIADGRKKIADLERQLKVAQLAPTQLRKDLAELEKLLADNNITRPTECLNCGKYKDKEEDFGGVLLQPRMGTFGVSKYANAYYIASTGTWTLCENAEEGNGGQYKETEGGAITYFGNTWNSCSKQEGDEGICRGCSFATLGMLTPKRLDVATKVGGFEYRIPTCCFHMGCAKNCVVWKKNTQLVCPQIANIPKMNASPMEVRRGILPTLTPSMVKLTGQLASMDIKVGGRGLDGEGGSYQTTVARWVGEEADTTMRDYIARHLAKGRTHTEQVANLATVVATTIDTPSEGMATAIATAMTGGVVLATEVAIRAPDAQTTMVLAPNALPMPPTIIHRNGHDYNFHSIYTYNPDPATTIHYAIYGTEGVEVVGSYNMCAFDSDGGFFAQASNIGGLVGAISRWGADSDTDSDSDSD